MGSERDRSRQIDDLIQWLLNIARRDNLIVERAAENLPFVDPELLAEALEKIHEIARGIIVGGEPGLISLTGSDRPKPWYAGPQVDDVYWPSLRRHLADSGWDVESLNSLDVSSTKVLANCANPASTDVRTRGLVLGYIQSGKTTNFTAVISKAADAGYRMFIVLSGVSNSLRRQTQLRLSEQLAGLRPLNWDGLTDELRDMGKPRRFGFAGLAQPGVRTLAVVKKNPTRLRNLINFLEAANNAGALGNCPILVIDDEADQASLSPDLTEEKRSAINELVVKLLSSFPKVAYVAYTATPFANFFVDPQYPENLYPRDFIVSLPEPVGYFGARRMYGSSDQDPPEIDVVRFIPEQEVPLLVPPRNRATTFNPSMSDSLRQAIRWFFLASTARRLMNGGVQPHSTMMIHTSERVAQHRSLWNVVSAELERIRNAVSIGLSDELEEFERLWMSETSRVDARQFGNDLPELSKVLAGLEETLVEMGDLSSPDNPTCGLLIDNGRAERRLLYDNALPKPVIVIGGNTLARGLTLEGLVSSVFVRSVSLYDSLLQMARWFGYRRGYESLPRVWMPTKVADNFAHLSRVEQEIREEIERYADSNITPMQVAVRILTHPAMGITRAQMMKAVRTVRVGYSGAQVDTAYLLNDVVWLKRNLDAAKALARCCVRDGHVDSGVSEQHVLFREVPHTAITDFFAPSTGYRVQPAAGSRFTEAGVLQYIESRVRIGELTSWSVAFFGTRDGRSVDLCDGLTIRTSDRGRDPNRTVGKIVSIGDHLPAPSHLAIDLPTKADSKLPIPIWRDRQNPPVPLLMIYVVNRDSVAAARGLRQDLGIVEDFLGIGICFPSSNHESPDGYVEVVLPSPTDDGEDDDFDPTEVDVEGSVDEIIHVGGS